MKPQRCKGCRDLLPEEMVKFRYIEEVFRSACLKWGYGEIRTPVLEYLHLFTSAGTLTPQMLSQVYSFLDWNGWSGERVVLRPEGTIPAARLYVENRVTHRLSRLFYVENVFRFEETSTESRERWQCGVELIGSALPVADAEIILLALEVLERLGCKGIELRLSHAGLLKGLLPEPAQDSPLLEGISTGSATTLRGESGEHHSPLPSWFEHKGKSAGFLKNLLLSYGQAIPRLKPCFEEFIAVAELLSQVGCEYQIDFASGKGFEYYTGVIFQLYFSGRKIGGGGRYNDLIPLVGGEDVPASGFALYLDSLTGFVSSPAEISSKVAVKVDSALLWKEGFDLARCLREAGYTAEMVVSSQKVGGSRWVISVQGSRGKSSFLLRDEAMDKEKEISSPQELLQALKEQDAENSPS